MKNFKVIAEIGNVHIGSLKRAKKLAYLAKLAGADALKSQKRNPYESVKKKLWNKPHPKQIFAYGKTYLEHRINVELSINEHKELKEYCEKMEMDYFVSVWDITSAKKIIKELKPKFIKIPSPCNNNYKLINYILDNFEKDIYISTGMTTKKEREELYKYLLPYKSKIVIFHCTSGYPVPFENIYLKEISLLKKIFPRVGFSNHGYGIALEPVSYILGARYFERHFIDDRTFRHSDASASLESQGLYKLIRDLKGIQKAFQYKPDNIIDLEQEQRNKLKIEN